MDGTEDHTSEAVAQSLATSKFYIEDKSFH